VKFTTEEAAQLLAKHRIPVAKAAPAAGTETYVLRATYDGLARLPIMIGSDVAGQNLDDLIAEQPDKVRRRHYSVLTGWSDYRAKEFVRSLGLTGRDLVQMTRIVSGLAQILLDYDLTIVDVQSVARQDDGGFAVHGVDLDMEEEGFARQKPILDELGIEDADVRGVRPPTEFEIQATHIDDSDPRGIISPVAEFDGDMGLVIGAGGGSITTFDAILRHGGKPANYCAIGGNPSVSKTEKLTKLVLQRKGVKKICVISNVVSNTRADLVARGVIKGVLALGKQPKDVITVFRVPGAWEEDAVKILEKYEVPYFDRSTSLSDAARMAVERAKA
jgi:succinyl-CoA synthetase beta subunit/citryl-CoA synthetase large subunit